jgi:haloalkane dehalogenase
MHYPAWLDRSEYPFAAHTLEVEGGRMHYVDEGSGPTVLMVHGTPTWSFLYAT